jgi:hypothetical protein
MKRHTLVGCLGKLERRGLKSSAADRVTRLLLGTVDGRLEYGLANVLRSLNRLGAPPTEMGVDLLILATLIHAADTRIARDTESQDTWTREFRLIVPVSDQTLWQKAGSVVETMLAFLTGDLWRIEFVPRPRAFKLVVGGRKAPKPPRLDQVSLFSGGLDSLVGAVDALERGANPLFISHAAEGATSGAQKACFRRLEANYPDRSFARVRAWIDFPKGTVKKVKSENTTRGRSFLFIALGVAAGSGLGRDFVLDVPENGLIALNVPLDVLRLGSLSTRTTHPFYLARWNELIGKLGVPGVVRNPYWNQTKGEMIAQSKNAKLLRRLTPKSMSCSSPTKGRFKGLGIQHCGYCVPCLIRRASIQKAWGRGKDRTTYTVPKLAAQPLNTHEAEGRQARSFQVALARLKANPGIERFLIHKPGSLRDHPERVPELAAVYRRGMEEVGAILSRVATAPK